MTARRRTVTPSLLNETPWPEYIETYPLNAALEAIAVIQRRIAEHPTELRELDRLVSIRTAVSEAIWASIHSMRTNRYPIEWRWIAERLNMTKQGAQQAYARSTAARKSR